MEIQWSKESFEALDHSFRLITELLLWFVNKCHPGLNI